MTAIPNLHATDAAPGTVGEVAMAASHGGYLVDCGAARMPAAVAVSCLVAPEPGDLVMLGRTPDRLYILSVLERRGGQPVRLLAEGDVEIGAAGGKLSLLGAKGVEIATPGTLGVTAGEVAVQGRRGRVTLQELSWVGRSLAAHVGRIRVVGEAIETLMDRVLSRAKRSYRFVEEGEHLRAGEIDHRASGNLHLRGENAVVNATTVVKVDGGQIHLG